MQSRESVTVIVAITCFYDRAITGGRGIITRTHPIHPEKSNHFHIQARDKNHRYRTPSPSHVPSKQKKTKKPPKPTPTSPNNAKANQRMTTYIHLRQKTNVPSLTIQLPEIVSHLRSHLHTLPHHPIPSPPLGASPPPPLQFSRSAYLPPLARLPPLPPISSAQAQPVANKQ